MPQSTFRINPPYSPQCWLPPEHLNATATSCTQAKGPWHDVLFSSQISTSPRDHQSAALQPAFFPRPIPVLALSGGSHRDCARSRLQKPSHNDTHLRIVRLVAATHRSHKPSQPCLGILETRNQLDIFSEKGTANAPPGPRLPI
jgi:hypothetical protein